MPLSKLSAARHVWATQNAYVPAILIYAVLLVYMNPLLNVAQAAAFVLVLTLMIAYMVLKVIG